MKKISVITINLNNCQGLEASIQSVSRQTLRDQVEYIVIDGLSEDGSKEIIEKYSDQIETISIEADNGIFDAMNKGVELATGDYTYFLNSGDVFASNTVLASVANAIASQVAHQTIVCGLVNLIDNGTFIAIADFYHYIPHQGAFVETALLKQYKFDDSFKIYGDLDLWTRMEKGGEYSVLLIDEVIADFALGGIGNNPAYLYRQYKDRQKYFLKHKIYAKWLTSSLNFVIFQSCYSLLGKERYFVFKTKFTSFKNRVLRLFNPSK